MNKQFQRRWFRIVALDERNWVAMALAFLVFVIVTLTAILLLVTALTMGGLWLWVTCAVFSLASLLSLLACITCDMAWSLISLIISRQH